LVDPQPQPQPQPQSRSGRLSLWGVLWCLAGGAAFSGLVFAMVIVGDLYPFGGHEWLVLPFLLLPLVAPSFAVSRHPGRLATALALLTAAGVVALGVICAALMGWADAHGWTGERCCEAVFTTPWSGWRALMLAYAGFGVALLGVLILALRVARRSAARTGAGHLEGETS
jgi:hypothetical protein